MRYGLMAPVVLGAALTGCEGDTPTPPAPPATVAEVRIDPVPPSANLHVGDSFQLSAALFDASGKEIVGRQIAWSSSDESVAVISSDGVLGVLAPGPGIVTARASVDGVSDSELVSIGGWEFSQGPQAGPGLLFAVASLAANVVADERPPRLSIRCASDTLKVFVGFDFVISGGDVGYRLDDGAERREAWEVSASFQKAFYPFDDVKAFASEIGAADTMFFEAERFDAGPRPATFVLAGLPELLPEVIGSCPERWRR